MPCLDQAAVDKIAAGLAFVVTTSLPALVLVAVLEILIWSLIGWLPPLVFTAGAALLVIVAINASYRDGDWRPVWRRRLEVAGAVLLLPLAILAGMALAARVMAFGFTANRVMAAALVLLLAAYALAYLAAALISLGGGRSMERIETANLAMAEQSWRLTHRAVTPGKFDDLYLSRSGLRFGHEALETLRRASTSKP